MELPLMHWISKLSASMYTLTSCAEKVLLVGRSVGDWIGFCWVLMPRVAVSGGSSGGVAKLGLG